MAPSKAWLNSNLHVFFGVPSGKSCGWYLVPFFWNRLYVSKQAEAIPKDRWRFSLNKTLDWSERFFTRTITASSLHHCLITKPHGTSCSLGNSAIVNWRGAENPLFGFWEKSDDVHANSLRSHIIPPGVSAIRNYKLFGKSFNIFGFPLFPSVSRWRTRHGRILWLYYDECDIEGVLNAGVIATRR